jgi:hypothetical protein
MKILSVMGTDKGFQNVNKNDKENVYYILEGKDPLLMPNISGSAMVTVIFPL